MRIVRREDGRHQVVTAATNMLIARRVGDRRRGVVRRPDQGHRPRHGRRRRVHGGRVVAARHFGGAAGAGRRVLAHQAHKVGEGVLAPAAVLVVLVQGGGAVGGVALRRAVVQVLRGQA